MTHNHPNGTVEKGSIEPFINYRGQPMFAMEKIEDGKVILNEYTRDGIIKHEFDSHIAMEMWVFKYRSLEFG